MTIIEFLALFGGDFAPFLLPVYVEGQAYFTGDVVYYEPNFYTSLTDGNTNPPTDITTWQLTKDSVNNYIQDSDIQRAFAEAKVNFNPSIFPDCETRSMMFNYLAAHYLVIDITNRMNPLSVGYSGLVQSKSVGSVSESYAIPDWMKNNPVYGPLAQTGYGRKYLSLIMPCTTGVIICTPGRTTIG